MLSTLIMPYSNFDDVLSLKVVYNHFLSKDADLNLVEFVAEKLLFLGIDETEIDEPQTNSKKPIPVSTSIVKIQSGSLFQTIHLSYLVVINSFIFNAKTSIQNQNFADQEYLSCIFKPPSPLG